jgi:hypothetical protein
MTAAEDGLKAIASLKFPVTMADLDRYIGSKLALVNMA